MIVPQLPIFCKGVVNASVAVREYALRHEYSYIFLSAVNPQAVSRNRRSVISQDLCCIQVSDSLGESITLQRIWLSDVGTAEEEEKNYL